MAVIAVILLAVSILFVGQNIAQSTMQGATLTVDSMTITSFDPDDKGFKADISCSIDNRASLAATLHAGHVSNEIHPTLKFC